jgi:uncharacterized membrane protein
MSTVSLLTAAPRGRQGVFGWVVMVVLASLVSLASSRYLAGGALMIPPPLKPNFMGHPAAFYVHIGGASTALLIGPWQFLEGLRRRHRLVHRAMGMVYVTACLVGGLAALPIALGSNGGPVAAAGFLTLAVLWLWTTARAVAAIASGDIASHRRWMVRSFALTLAGVTLRLYLPVAFITPFGFHDAYAAIAWLCWAPNLVLADRLAWKKHAS